jgi:hypothetical protein
MALTIKGRAASPLRLLWTLDPAGPPPPEHNGPAPAPGRPSRLRAARPPQCVPLFRFLEAKSETGLLPPGINMFRPEIFLFFGAGKIGSPPGTGPVPIFTQQNPAGKPRFQGRFRVFSAGPLLTPWPNLNRGFKDPRMAVSPLNRTLI